MAIEELRQWLGGNINSLREELLQERYEISPVRKNAG
jgi:hypothetical protein